MKVCPICGNEKPLSEFHKDSRRPSGLHHACRTCVQENGKWDYAGYAKVQAFTSTEQYMIQKLAKRPTLSAALDNMFRRNPRRWHQVMVASALARKEQAV